VARSDLLTARVVLAVRVSQCCTVFRVARKFIMGRIAILRINDCYMGSKSPAKP